MSTLEKYYNLEPLLFNSNNAIQIFHSWVLAKIIYSIYDLMIDLEHSDINISEEEIFKRRILKNHFTSRTF